MVHDEIQIGPMGAGEIPAVVALHRAALSGDHLARLGRGYLERRFYPHVAASAGARVFVARSGARPIGFHLVTRDHTGFYGRVVRRTGFSLALALVVRPWLWGVPLTFLRRKVETASPGDAGWEGRPEITLLVVDPAVQRRRVAQTLVEAGWSWLRGLGESECVAHVEIENDPTRRFCEEALQMDRLGEECRGPRRFVVYGRSI